MLIGLFICCKGHMTPVGKAGNQEMDGAKKTD